MKPSSSERPGGRPTPKAPFTVAAPTVRATARPARWLLVATALVLALAGCSTSRPDPTAARATSTTAAAPRTVLATLGAEPDLLTFRVALHLATPDSTLAGAGPYVVFAPTNQAFAALAKGTIDASTTAGKQKLAQLLDDHIVTGKATGAVGTGSVATSGGSTLRTAEVGGALVVTDGQGHAVKVTRTLHGTNGVIYVVGGVLLPS